MGRNTIITEIGNALVALLRKEMIPDTLQNSDSIGLCYPTDKGDYIVGINLYDIAENDAIRTNTMVSQGTNIIQYPPKLMSLFYMVTVYSTGDIKYRSGEEQKILGRIIQVLNDFNCLNSDTLEPMLSYRSNDITIQMLTMDLEDKMRIYNVPNSSYKLSLFYKVAPVEIESLKTKTIQRVIDIDYRLNT